MDTSRAALLKRYEAFTDEALLEAAAAGPEAYSAVAWSVIEQLVATRHISPESIRTDTNPVSTSTPISRAPSSPISPYLIISRLRAQRWPPDAPLPLAGRDAIVVLALLSGSVGVLLILLVLILRDPAVAAPPNLAMVVLTSALSLGFAVSANRPPTPRTWRFAMLYCAIPPILYILREIAQGVLDVVGSALTLLASACWLLYFARRRATYGLAPWLAVH